MYTPALFREDRPEILHALIHSARLATLVSNGAGGLPDVTHLPLLLAETEGERGVLHGHVARANPHWQALAAAGRAVAIFRGPEAYVSPNFYPSKAEHHRVVPTWNYEAVHAEGTVEVFDDEARLHALVSTLTAAHEARRASAGTVGAWAVSDAPPAFIAGQLKGIVGFALRIEVLTGKRKLSQNRPAADREGATTALAASDDPRDAAAAAAMRAAAAGR